MTIQINTNATAAAASLHLNRNSQALQKSLKRLASGSRILQPADDSGGLAVSMKLKSSVSRLSGAYNNVQNGNFSPHSVNRRMQGYSSGGKVHGPGGIDKVGPVLLDKGEYVIKASSVNKVEKKYPGFFDRLNSSKMKDGGLVDGGSSSTDITNSESNESSSSNVTVNINVSSGGSASVDGGDGNQQAFAAKVKDAVLGVISQEKRVGGMLRGR